MISTPTMTKATKRTITAALALTLLASTGLAVAQDNQGPPPASATWEQAPPQFVEAQRRGYRDGVHAAREDYDHHRPADVNYSKDYRNPHFMAPADRETYRSGFAEGYRVAVQHIYYGH
jgi:hypothetical protein